MALVDELAHTNVPGSRNAKRWQDIEELLDAGIDVISTVNIQHLESLNDVVEQITGVPQRETVPDEVVRRADQVELVDMAPEALRRRMAHGNIYPPEKVDAALANYFRVGNLTALRELALLWLADKVDDQLDRYRAEHGIAATWEARERVVVALTGGPEGDTLIRRAARIAGRSKGADLLAVHVARSDGLTGADPAELARQRTLVESLGGTYHQVVGDDVPSALLDFARGVNATQLVLGASRREAGSRRLFAPGVGVDVDRAVGPDRRPHGHPRGGQPRGAAGPSRGGAHGRPPASPAGLAGAARACRCSPLLLATLRGKLSLPSDILLFLLLVVGGGAGRRACGRRCAAAVVGFAAAQLLLHPAAPHASPSPSRRTSSPWCVFVAGRRGGQRVVDLAARRTREAARAERGRRDAVHPGGQRAARRDGAAVPAGAAPGDLRAGLGDAAGAAPGDARRPTTSASRSAGGSSATAGGPPVHQPRATADADVPVDDDLALVAAAAGCSPRPTGGCWRRSPPRRPWRCARSGSSEEAEQAAAARRGRPDAHRAARRGQPRPAHPARLGQGGGGRACAATDVDWSRRGPGGTARHRRRVAGPARPAGREPARHEPPAGRRARR